MDFKIELKRESIYITIDSLNPELKNIKSFIKRNFQTQKIEFDYISLYPNLLATERERENRLKLIKWFIKKSKLDRDNLKIAKQILKSFEQRIEIEILQYRVLKDSITIKISKLDREILKFRVENRFMPLIENIVLNFIKREFEIESIVKFDKSRRELTLKFSKESARETLHKLLNRDSLVGKSVTFLYNIDDIKHLIKDLKLNNYRANLTTREYIVKLRASYSILELKQGEKRLDLIKKQYLKFAKKYHPDRFQNSSIEKLKIYNEKFLELKEAYEMLKSHISK